MKFLNFLKKWLIIGFLAAFFIWVVVFNWSFLFKKKVVGEVVAAEKVEAPLTVIATEPGSKAPLNPQVFSFSVGIKDRFSSEIFMSSSEDRQWAAVNKGNCVVAVFFPYPPWQLDKGGTYHNARLLRNFTSCDQLKTGDGWLEALQFFFLMN